MPKFSQKKDREDPCSQYQNHCINIGQIWFLVLTEAIDGRDEIMLDASDNNKT